MRLVGDPAAQAAAVKTLTELMLAGYAGLDSYDPDVFVVDAPYGELRDHADVALDVLAADFHRDGAHGANRNVLQARLQPWARRMLHLDEPGAPRILTPLASRRVDYFDLAKTISQAHYERTFGEAAS